MRHISASELLDWIEFFTVEGFESDNQNRRNTVSTITTANALGFEIKDFSMFMLNPWNNPSSTHTQTQDELIANLEFLRISLGRTS